MDTSDPIIMGSLITALVIYFGVMIFIGFFYRKKNQTQSDYTLGGRKLPKLVSAMSAEASDMSGWLLLGLPGTAYFLGLSSAGWTAIGLAIGTYLNWKLIAKRLRIYTHKANDSITIPEFLKNRFADKKEITSIIAAIFIIVFFIVYIASQFVAGSTLFMNVLGIDPVLAMLIGALVVVVYTFFGGFRAVCLTDTIQALLMALAIIVVPIVALILIMVGCAPSGIDATMFNDAIVANSNYLNLFTNPAGEFVGVFAIVTGLAWGFGYFGQPHILPRFMGIRDPNEIPKARRIAMIWVIISMAAAIFIGLLGRVFFSPEFYSTKKLAENVVIDTAGAVFASAPFIAGIIYCGILGAIMSTASSMMLSSASSISQDLVKRFSKKALSDKNLIIISKISVLIISALALLVAFTVSEDSSVYDIVSFSWAGFGCTCGSVILVGLFWKRMNWQGALAGIIGGGITAFLWFFIAEGIFENPLYEMVPGVIVSLLCIFIVTKLTSPPPKEVTDTFDAYTKELGDQKT